MIEHSSPEGSESWRIGVDTGGTFTDTIFVDNRGRIGIGKALTTAPQPAEGVLHSMQAAAEQVDVSLEEIADNCTYIGHGTTVGLNALLEGSLPSVGLLVTEGFEDTLAIGRMRKLFPAEDSQLTMAARWESPPIPIPRRLIIGVKERMGAGGEVINSLDEESVRDAIESLLADEVESVGIALLWSFANSSHEDRVARLIRQEMPDVHVTKSFDLVPRLGEYERMTTVAVNAAIAPVVSSYLTDLRSKLDDAGFKSPLYITQSEGGVERAEGLVDRPVLTLGSGPASGVAAASSLGERLGHGNIVATDVGGTSFDVGLIREGRPILARHPAVADLPLATAAIDIQSIGTGGGSLATIDPDTGSMRVGPLSAGSSPGPAAYGRGGTRPTLTDAAVALGYLTRLTDDIPLRRDLACTAIDEHVGGPLGLTTEAAAQGIVTISTAQMADLISRLTVQKGLDLRDFVIYGYGGAGPQYVGLYARELGVDTAIIPAFASVFSSVGAVATDVRSSSELGAPQPFPPSSEWLQTAVSRLRNIVQSRLAADHSRDIQFVVQAGVRFKRQVHEVPVDLPTRITPKALEALVDSFLEEYELLYGRGTASSDAEMELGWVRVEGKLSRPLAFPEVPSGSTRKPSGRSKVYFQGDFIESEIWDGTSLAAEVCVRGPALVELSTTTIVVYPEQELRRIDGGHFKLTTS